MTPIQKQWIKTKTAFYNELNAQAPDVSEMEVF